MVPLSFINGQLQDVEITVKKPSDTFNPKIPGIYVTFTDENNNPIEGAGIITEPDNICLDLFTLATTHCITHNCLNIGNSGTIRLRTKEKIGICFGRNILSLSFNISNFCSSNKFTISLLVMKFLTVSTNFHIASLPSSSILALSPL